MNLVIQDRTNDLLRFICHLAEGPPSRPPLKSSNICFYSVNKLKMYSFKEKIELAERKIGLREVVQITVFNQCKREGLHILADISLDLLEQYTEQVVLAAWLDFSNEVDAEELSWTEQKSELTERAMTDVTKLLRLKALNKLK